MTEEEFLKNYDSNQFFKPSVTVDSIIFTIRDVETDNIHIWVNGHCLEHL